MSRFDERKPMTADTSGKPIPGEPDALKGARPVRGGVRKHSSAVRLAPTLPVRSEAGDQ
jgi:hypothetical protein